MKFDKTKVFTSFNCDEVKIGSKGYFADTKDSLIDRVQSEDKSYYHKMIEYNGNDHEFPFVSNMINSAYRYFYLVEEPQEPTKRPCTREELVEMLKKQGLPMLKWNDNDSLYLVDKLIQYDCKVNDVQYTYSELCKDYTLLDGTELWVNNTPPECISPTPDEIGG